MSNYKFYVYKWKSTYFDTLKNAIIAIANEDANVYTALGVEKDDMYACDLLIKNGNSYTISKDIESSQIFKNDSLISINAIAILKQEFNLN